MYGWQSCFHGLLLRITQQGLPSQNSVFLVRLPASDSVVILVIVHFMEASVVAAAIAFEACGGLKGMDHESKAWAGREEGQLLGT